jgi:hypothetical protein
LTDEALDVGEVRTKISQKRRFQWIK